jgi:hypothetical protein
MGGFFVQRQPAAAILRGPPVAVAGKMGSMAPGDAPWPVARTHAVAEWRDGVKLELAGDNEEKREGGHRRGGGDPIYKGWLPSMRNKETTPILSPIWSVGEKPYALILLDSVAAMQRKETRHWGGVLA